MFSDIVYKKILNYCLVEARDLSLVGVYSKRNALWDNILYVISLSLVCKRWAMKVIPCLCYPSFKIKNAAECGMYLKYQTYGITQPQSVSQAPTYPPIEINSIDLYNLFGIGDKLLDQIYNNTLYSSQIRSIHFANQGAFEYEDDSGTPLIMSLNSTVGKEKFVQNVANIQSLEFSIRSQGDVHLIQYILENNTSLTSVRLSILFEGTYPLGKMLSSHPSLKTVYLQQILYDKMPHALPVAGNHLETIEFSNFNFRDNSTLTLIDLIQQSENLTKIYLNGVSINRLMIGNLLEALAHNTRIKEFTFTHNESINASQRQILSLLATNKTMTRFEMTFDVYDAEKDQGQSPQTFTETQHTPSSFETLRLSSRIDLDTLPLACTSSITKLVLYHIPAISTLETHFQNVSTLELDYCDYTDTSQVCETICLLGKGTLLPNLVSLRLGVSADEWTWRQFFSNLSIHNRTLHTLAIPKVIQYDILTSFIRSNHPTISSLLIWAQGTSTPILHLVDNTSITNLHLSLKSYFGDEAFDLLLQLLVKPTLKHLYYNVHIKKFDTLKLNQALKVTQLESFEPPSGITKHNPTLNNILKFKSILPYNDIFK
ncbi:hypothetical protein CYY_002755 [Polysphondylium violaceum]|uniref:Uncharacterized protein n=1 Tax=Polysphondylium violaceum TaxID=133409 RepID=A0A8J4PZP7_9MYCE|nr:hypothetical protein CYY_002755 [Polysphondylium violaceum]